MEWTQAAPGLGSSGPLPPRRDIVVVILLAIFTFGIYNLYWLYTMYRDTHQHVGKPHKAQLALVLAIVTFALMWVAMAVYFVAAFGIGMAGGDPQATGVAIGGFIGAFVFLMVAALASTGIQVWMMWGAARGAELVLNRYGRKPDMPPLVHALVPIVLNVWVYVAIGLIQNDMNKLHAPVTAPGGQAYPQA